MKCFFLHKHPISSMKMDIVQIDLQPVVIASLAYSMKNCQNMQLPTTTVLRHLHSASFNWLTLSSLSLPLLKLMAIAFRYTGGVQKQLKGSLSYYKVKIDSIVHSVSYFDVLRLTKNVIVFLYDLMTPEQRRKAAKKNRIRTDKVLTALQWLLLNNEEW